MTQKIKAITDENFTDWRWFWQYTICFVSVFMLIYVLFSCPPSKKNKDSEAHLVSDEQI